MDGLLPCLGPSTCPSKFQQDQILVYSNSDQVASFLEQQQSCPSKSAQRSCYSPPYTNQPSNLHEYFPFCRLTPHTLSTKTFLSLLEVFRRTSMRDAKTSLQVLSAEFTYQVFLLQISWRESWYVCMLPYEEGRRPSSPALGYGST